MLVMNIAKQKFISSINEIKEGNFKESVFEPKFKTTIKNARKLLKH